MKASILAAATLMLFAPSLAGAASAGDDGSQPALEQADVAYYVVLEDGDDVLSAPTMLGRFGEPVQIEVSDSVRVVVVADRPDKEGRSHTVAKLAVYRNHAWLPPKVMSMPAVMSATPSFEYAVEGTSQRLTVRPRLVSRPN